MEANFGQGDPKVKLLSPERRGAEAGPSLRLRPLVPALGRVYQATTSSAATAMGVKGGRLATVLKAWSYVNLRFGAV
jgi:hypothetical protein